MSGKRLRFVAAVAVVLLAGIALAAIATGTKFGATRQALSYSGRITGASGNVDLTFHFLRNPSGAELCAPTITGVALATDGSFTLEVPIESCSFDGSDVTYRLDAVTSAGSISSAVTPIDPVPYAKYADVAAALPTQPDGTTHLGPLVVGGNVNVTGTLNAAQITGLKMVTCTSVISTGINGVIETTFASPECGGTIPGPTCTGFLKAAVTPGGAVTGAACCPSDACLSLTDPGFHVEISGTPTSDGTISCVFLCN